MQIFLILNFKVYINKNYADIFIGIYYDFDIFKLILVKLRLGSHSVTHMSVGKTDLTTDVILTDVICFGHTNIERRTAIDKFWA